MAVIKAIKLFSLEQRLPCSIAMAAALEVIAMQPGIKTQDCADAIGYASAKKMRGTLDKYRLRGLLITVKGAPAIDRRGPPETHWYLSAKGAKLWANAEKILYG